MTTIDFAGRPRGAGISALVAALERVLRAESSWIDLIHDRPEHNRWRRGVPRNRARRAVANQAARLAVRRTLQ